jgi:hypothetical protein
MNIISALRRYISNRSPISRDAEEIDRQKELRDSIAAIPALSTTPPDSPAAADWLNNRRRLRELLSIGDPRRFLEWDVIHKTMFVGSPPHVQAELLELKTSSHWSSRWKSVLREDAAGCPRRCRWRFNSSGNLIHHAYHLLRCEPLLGRTIDQFDKIIEFGGGYGSFCRLAWRLGFRGRYVIFDLPEFLSLQKYFLQSVGVPIAQNPGSSGATFISDLNQSTEEAVGGGLFVGCWSISETPLDFRKQVLASVNALTDYLIGYQNQFQEVDNIGFFSSWSTAYSKLKWQELLLEHTPGNRYLVGSARI